MRVDLTLDPGTVALLQRRMARTGKSLMVVVNAAIRAGLADEHHPGNSEYRLVPHDMGAPRVPTTQTLRLAADLEDEQIARKLAHGR